MVQKPPKTGLASVCFRGVFGSVNPFFEGGFWRQKPQNTGFDLKKPACSVSKREVLRGGCVTLISSCGLRVAKQ